MKKTKSRMRIMILHQLQISFPKGIGKYNDLSRLKIAVSSSIKFQQLGSIVDSEEHVTELWMNDNH